MRSMTELNQKLRSKIIVPGDKILVRLKTGYRREENPIEVIATIRKFKKLFYLDVKIGFIDYSTINEIWDGWDELVPVEERDKK